MKDIHFLESKGIDVKSSLELFGDESKYTEKLGEFLVGIHTKIKQLIVFMQKPDMPNYSNCVRSMKNDARFFGFNKLADMAAEHEEKSMVGDLYYVTEHINDLIQETNSAIVTIQEYLNGGEEIKKEYAETVDAIETYEQDTILVVDDSNIVRNFVKRVFAEKYNIGTANDGEEAINLIEKNKDNGHIKAILLDLSMPKVDGFGVLEHMRSHNLLEKIPVSIISGDSSKETIDRAFTYNIVDMLSKPFNDSSISIVVEKTLMRNDL
ncbi:MAG: response regulator [Bacilli bacterium]|nr:response regulator [Bacilli bacterium]MBR6137491.1 response regulator [Bacilli bacterium]